MQVNYLKLGKKLISICAAVECSNILTHLFMTIFHVWIMMNLGVANYQRIKFGEATAVLAGNSLLTLAFEIISEKNNLLSPVQKSQIISSLASCSGHTGIAGGQELDLKFENKKKNMKQIIDMQKKKTEKLFSFCLSQLLSLEIKVIERKFH